MNPYDSTFYNPTATLWFRSLPWILLLVWFCIVQIRNLFKR